MERRSSAMARRHSARSARTLQRNFLWQKTCLNSWGKLHERTLVYETSKLTCAVRHELCTAQFVSLNEGSHRIVWSSRELQQQQALFLGRGRNLNSFPIAPISLNLDHVASDNRPQALTYTHWSLQDQVHTNKGIFGFFC